MLNLVAADQRQFSTQGCTPFNNPMLRQKQRPLFPLQQLRFPDPAKGNRCFRRMTTMAGDAVTEPQKTIILNDHGEQLVGLLHDTGSKEVVVLCHGFRSSKEHRTMVNLSVALENEGISAFRFDFAGNGESDGSFAYGNYMREVEDLRNVVKHFNGAQRIVTAIVGHSKGGGIVLLYASKCPDVQTVVNISGRYDLKTGVAERLGEDFMERIKKDGYIDVKCEKTGNLLYRVVEEALMDRLNTNMHEACLRIDKDCSLNLRRRKPRAYDVLKNEPDLTPCKAQEVGLQAFVKLGGRLFETQDNMIWKSKQGTQEESCTKTFIILFLHMFV